MELDFDINEWLEKNAEQAAAAFEKLLLNTPTQSNKLTAEDIAEWEGNYNE